MTGCLDTLLTGERVALNLAMRLSGIATFTRRWRANSGFAGKTSGYAQDNSGLRVLEKYATQVGGAMNHRMGLDDGVMIKDNHIAAAGGIGAAIALIRQATPYPLMIEVETESLEQVNEALQHGADIIMLDNMSLELMKQAVALIGKKMIASKLKRLAISR